LGGIAIGSWRNRELKEYRRSWQRSRKRVSVRRDFCDFSDAGAFRLARIHNVRRSI
jgi:hypothetical protein